MSAVAIRAALNAALTAITPPLATAAENGVVYTPVTGTPYQAVSLHLANPVNPEMGGTVEQGGFLQVLLRYPPNAGTGDATARAELIRAAFPRGRTLVASGVTVLITRTPEIAAGANDADRYVVPVRIRFRSTY